MVLFVMQSDLPKVKDDLAATGVINTVVWSPQSCLLNTLTRSKYRKRAKKKDANVVPRRLQFYLTIYGISSLITIVNSIEVKRLPS